MNGNEIVYDGIFFVMGVFLTIITRLYSNAILKNNYADTIQGDPINLLPWSNSIYSTIGFVSILGSIIWAFFISVWVGLAFVIAYFLTNLVPARLNDLRKLYNLSDYKKCVSCKNFHDYSYYGIIKQNPIVLNDTCVSCTNSDAWNTVQEIKTKL